jgi:Flp pilus assembly protein CpaB
MSITTNASKKSLFNGRKMWFIFSAAAALAAALITFVLMNTATAKDTYYVLSSDIPARTQITPDLLTEVQTSAGSVPPSSLGISDLTEESYSLYSLKAGDILTSSNTGDKLSLTEGLPEDYVVASFTADPSMAAGGNVKRGDYIDIIALIDDSTVTGVDGTAASYVLQRALVIDATVDLDTYSSDDSAAETTTADGTGTTTTDTGAVSDNTSGAAIRSGIPTMFTVGLSPENAAILALATQQELYVVLSSADSVNNETVPTGLTPATNSGIWGNPRNAGEGTDNTFGQGGGVEKPSATDNATEEPSAPSSPTVTEEPTTDETTEGEGSGE